MERLRVYPVVKRKFLNANERCFKCGRKVKRKERTLHHFFGRIEELLVWVPGFRMADWQCHQYIESHRLEAIEKGWRADEKYFNRPSLVIGNPICEISVPVR